MHALLLVCALSAYAPQDAPNGWAYDLDDLSNIYAHSNYHLSLEFQANGPTTIVLDERWEVVVGPRGGEGDERAGAIKGVAGPLVDAARGAGERQSLDISYWMEDGEEPYITVWLNDRLVQDRLHLAVEAEVGDRGPGEEEGLWSALADEAQSRACDWGEDFTVIATFRTTGRGTIVSMCPPKGIWVADAKALFVRDGMLVYDIGWLTGLSMLAVGAMFAVGFWIMPRSRA